MKILVTGGAGYIGSTTASACLDAGIDVVILDDLSTGRRDFLEHRSHYIGDIADGRLIGSIVSEHPDISVVVHCAAKIVVPDSVADPLGYYRNNVAKTIEMLEHLRRHDITKVVFSSSAAIYSGHDGPGLDEASAIAPSSPYASTKAMVEAVLRDAAAAGELRAIALRYFNPIGADPLLRTGIQVPSPSHVLGKIVTAWSAGLPFTVTGGDWQTRDGSGLRDFIHVWDLALAHVRAIEGFDSVVSSAHPYRAINVGTGAGTTVLELVAAFERVTGQRLEVSIGPRRPGDTAGGYARTELVAELLGWRAGKSLEDAIRDSLAWSDRLAELDAAAAR